MASENISKFRESIPVVQKQQGDLKEKLQEVLAVINSGKLVSDDMADSVAESLKACREKETELFSLASELEINLENKSFEQMTVLADIVEKEMSLDGRRQVVFDYFRLTTTVQDTLDVLEESKKELQKVCRLIGDEFSTAFEPFSCLVAHVKSQKDLSDAEYDLISDNLGRKIVRAADRKQISIDDSTDISAWLDGSVELLQEKDPGVLTASREDVERFIRAGMLPDETVEAEVTADAEDDEIPETVEDTVDAVETAKERPIRMESGLLHPMNPIPKLKDPSNARFDDVLKTADKVILYLLDKLTFLGLMDKKNVIKDMREIYDCSAKKTEELLNYLENKGYLCTYEYDGRMILCFTELMWSCLNKESLKNLILRRFPDLDSIHPIIFYGIQDMPEDQFVEHLIKVDQYRLFIKKRDKKTAFREILPSSHWNAAKKRYEIVLLRHNPETGRKEKKYLALLTAKDYESNKVVPGDSVICYSPKIPVLKEFVDNVFYACLTDYMLLYLNDAKKWSIMVRTDK